MTARTIMSTPGGLIEVEESDDGVLHCYRHPMQVCDDITTVYKNKLDGRSHVNGKIIPFLSEVRVTLYEDPRTDVDVEIGDKDGAGDREVKLIGLVHDEQQIGVGPDFIGYVRDGEGRITLRALIIEHLQTEFLLGNAGCEGRFCPATGVADPTYVPNILDTLSVLATGMCMTCRTDDMVPDVEGSAPITRKPKPARRR